ncbi:hypothetical protein ACIQYS_14450 [Psychrobacillus sp. NPDC096426]|uniref:hypothetical protein n=1 Tax=Psychrobacillus sp. NPDC096426 TaxID=3364491 RepID=UPI00381D2431
MNRATISDKFGAEMEALTAGTRYEISSDSDDPTPILEGYIREIMYSMYVDAHSKELAIRYQRQIEEHFSELYEFSYGVSPYDSEYRQSSQTERVALMIVDEKARYTKQIEKLFAKNNRFYAALKVVDPDDRELLLDYFERNMLVEYEVLRSALKRNLKKLENFYQSELRKAEFQNEEISNSIEGTIHIREPISSEEKRKKRLDRLRKSMSGGN